MSGGAAGALVQSPAPSVPHRNPGLEAESPSVLRPHDYLCHHRLHLNPKGVTRSVVENLKNSPLKKFIVDLGLWKDKVFLIWVAANGLCKFGFFIPYVHLVKHAVQLGIPVHSRTNIMLFLGLTSMVSRIIFGRICDSERINRRTLTRPLSLGGWVALTPIPQSL
nr:monocarboxylate transporter 10 [Salvelinus alpinus]